ncbi:MAG TPA: lysophospholipid acyltransferase family protein [Candidatus Kapabacteria bacterium]|nr:lysophospholipid acyltransferase family protein [Candidatus Kapabacteria bacterium]
MKNLIDYIVATILLFLGLISKILGIRNRSKLGEIVGNCLRILSKSRADITLSNIKMALPELSLERQIDIMKQSYHNLGITLVELLALPSLNDNDLKKYIQYENIELLQEMSKRGKGVILLSGHFGNWELLAYTAGLFSKLPITVVVKPQSNKVSDRILNNYRTLKTNKVVPMANAARAIVSSLKNNECIALLVDQSADWVRDIFVDFFAYPTLTYEAPAKLSIHFDAPIVYGFAVRQADYTYKVKIYELDRSGLENCKEPIRVLTERHVKALEDIIRQYPGQWSWQHKRWKHTPPQS